MLTLLNSESWNWWDLVLYRNMLQRWTVNPMKPVFLAMMRASGNVGCYILWHALLMLGSKNWWRGGRTATELLFKRIYKPAVRLGDAEASLDIWRFSSLLQYEGGLKIGLTCSSVNALFLLQVFYSFFCQVTIPLLFFPHSSLLCSIVVKFFLVWAAVLLRGKDQRGNVALWSYIPTL